MSRIAPFALVSVRTVVRTPLLQATDKTSAAAVVPSTPLEYNTVPPELVSVRVVAPFVVQSVFALMEPINPSSRKILIATSHSI